MDYQHLTDEQKQEMIRERFAITSQWCQVHNCHQDAPYHDYNAGCEANLRSSTLAEDIKLVEHMVKMEENEDREIKLEVAHMTSKDRQDWLRQCGWRQGRDGLWRNDTYGGSFKLSNAVKAQLDRPVGDPNSVPQLPAHFITVAYTDGERRGCWVTGETPAKAISKLLARKGFVDDDKEIKYVSASKTDKAFDEILLTLTEIYARVRGDR